MNCRLLLLAVLFCVPWSCVDADDMALYLLSPYCQDELKLSQAQRELLKELGAHVPRPENAVNEQQFQTQMLELTDSLMEVLKPEQRRRFEQCKFQLRITERQVLPALEERGVKLTDEELKVLGIRLGEIYTEGARSLLQRIRTQAIREVLERHFGADAAEKYMGELYDFGSRDADAIRTSQDIIKRQEAEKRRRLNRRRAAEATKPRNPRRGGE